MRHVEGSLYYAGVVGEVDRLRRSFQFDIIHAHFTYPDGWAAVQLGKRYGVPVVITEHASWQAWADKSPLVRRQALQALSECDFHVSVGTALHREIAQYLTDASKLHVIPCGVDGSTFTLSKRTTTRSEHQVLFVGHIRHVKGLDILLRAMDLLARRGRKETLLVVGDTYYSEYARTALEARRLSQKLGLDGRVTFAAGRDHPEIARLMQESAVVVLPSRRETLGMVLVEALACGTPVVATRSGGPQDIVTDEVGLLTSVNDPEALAEAIAFVVDNRKKYDPERLHAVAMAKFSGAVVAEQYLTLYARAFAAHRARSERNP
jgi:glycosyltransferase involved in cell wall biosynthesis